MAVFAWPDLRKLNRVTEEQRGVAVSEKNARGLRPRWAPWARRLGMGVVVRSIQKDPSLDREPQGPMPRRLRVLWLLLPRRKQSRRGQQERQRQVGLRGRDIAKEQGFLRVPASWHPDMKRPGGLQLT